ncbi:hypothetical protein CFC21_085013 [Triticum aestivum]|uniref:Neprosin PEP catalytic domain-containing protein n=2 Tax=Triticum aestivum TaxID=4565 RepID=A0A3B6NWB7_WHEAT|nr:hypothetical protein CFC21_085013 [Triticum aestivum]
MRAKITIYEPKVKNDSKDLSASWIQINGRQRVDGLKNTICPDHDCGAFVQVSSSVGLGGRLKPVSIYRGPQYIIDVSIFKDPVSKNWWVSYGERNIHIGYWPKEIFHFMKDQCNSALWGGYVQGPTASSDSPRMGSGHFASEERGKAAVVRNILIVDNKNKYANPDARKARLVVTSSSKYTAKAYGYGYNDYGVHTYYGGPGAFV